MFRVSHSDQLADNLPEQFSHPPALLLFILSTFWLTLVGFANAIVDSACCIGMARVFLYTLHPEVSFLVKTLSQFIFGSI